MFSFLPILFSKAFHGSPLLPIYNPNPLTSYQLPPFLTPSTFQSRFTIYYSPLGPPLQSNCSITYYLDIRVHSTNNKAYSNITGNEAVTFFHIILRRAREPRNAIEMQPGNTLDYTTRLCPWKPYYRGTVNTWTRTALSSPVVTLSQCHSVHTLALSLRRLHVIAAPSHHSRINESPMPMQMMMQPRSHAIP